MPKTEHDFAIEAINNALVVLDNLSYVPVWLSDALCRLATGGGYAARTLYTDAEQTILRFCRPSVINGIVDLTTRGDLIERCVLLELGGIAERRDERDYWAAFEQAQPRILGTLLGGVAAALAHEADIQIDRPPRMADFARWVAAAEPA